MPVPPKGIRDIANFLYLVGADLIIGDHPHVVQVPIFLFSIEITSILQCILLNFCKDITSGGYLSLVLDGDVPF